MNGQTPPGLQQPVEVRYADNPAGKLPQVYGSSGLQQFKPWSQGDCQTGSWGAGSQKGGGPKNPMEMDFIMQQCEASGALPGGTVFNNNEQIALYINGLPPSCQ